MNGLLVESIVEAIVHRHAELVQAILVGSDIHLCATWQTGLDAAVLIEAEQLVNVAVLAVRPALVLLVEYEVRLLAVGVGYLVTILQSLDSIRPSLPITSLVVPTCPITFSPVQNSMELSTRRSATEHTA